MQEVGPFIQIALDLDSGSILGIFVVFVDLSYRTFRHRNSSVHRLCTTAYENTCVMFLHVCTAAFCKSPGAPPRTARLHHLRDTKELINDNTIKQTFGVSVEVKKN